MQSSQGIFLAVLYCFFNSEVQDVVKRQFSRLLTSRDIRRETRYCGTPQYVTEPADSLRRPNQQNDENAEAFQTELVPLRPNQSTSTFRQPNVLLFKAQVNHPGSL